MKRITLLRHDDAVKFLSSASALAARKSILLNRINQIEGLASSKLSDFILHWLMYMDDSEHEELRKTVMLILSEGRKGCKNIQDISLHQHLSLDSIGPDEITEICFSWHSLLFGIPRELDRKIITLSQPILNLVLNDDLEKLDDAYEALNEIEAELTSIDQKPGGILNKMFENRISISTIISILIDSFKPIEAGLRTLLYCAAEVSPEEISTSHNRLHYIRSTLTAYPPFRFINRKIRGDPVNWVAVDLVACHNTGLCDVKRSLVFGTGKHSCPGSSLAIDFFEKVLSVFSELRTQRCYKSQGEIVDIAGMCTVRKFRLQGKSKEAII